LMKPHGDYGEPWWLSGGGLEYLRNFTDYEPYKCHHISEYLINKLKASGIYDRWRKRRKPESGKAIF
jgi:hypothetical protein